MKKIVGPPWKGGEIRLGVDKVYLYPVSNGTFSVIIFIKLTLKRFAWQTPVKFKNLKQDQNELNSVSPSPFLTHVQQVV